jgi:hypothetical protein
MIRKKSTLRAVMSFVAIFVLSFSVLADTIRLRDGSIIKGTIVSFADGRFTVSIGEGARRRELSLAADEIASIEFEPHSPANSTSARINQPAGDSRILPVSTKAPPKVEVTDNIKPAPKVQVTDNTRTVSQNQPPQQPRIDPPANTTTKPAIKTVPQTRPQTNASPNTASPVGLNVKVLADNTANGWTNSGFVVKKGQRIRVTGSGSVSLGKGHTTTASGLPDLDDPGKLLKSVPTGALLAVIGDDNNDFIYIGESREFTAGRDGALYLGVNEANLNDNSGAFDVKIEIIPDI